MTIRQFTSDPGFRQRYWARNHVGWRHMDQTLPNAGHRALAELERAGVVSGVITQNVDLLHTKAGSRAVINLHGTYAQVVCLDCGYTMSRAALADSWSGSIPDSPSGPRRSAGSPSRPTPTPWSRHRVVPIVDCARCGGMLKPNIVYFGENVPKERVDEAYSLVDDADALLVAGSSLTVYSGFRFVRHAAALGIPIAIINRGRTRGDELAAVKVDSGCSPMLVLLQESSPATRHRACRWDEISRRIEMFAEIAGRNAYRTMTDPAAPATTSVSMSMSTASPAPAGGSSAT